MQTPLKNIPQSVKSKKIYYVWYIGLIIAIAFTLLIWALGPLLTRFLLLPDQGPSWYYWQLPVRDFLAQFIVWSLYISHQFIVWVTIYWAQKNLKEIKTRTNNHLTTYNWAMIGINLLFVVLHLAQTHIWFDGLAQDVPIWTSQGSVIVMLVVLLVLENPYRGLFLGRKAGKPFTAQVAGFFRRNHPYIFSWAIVYTFWFHPMANDPQLLTGFFYMFLLFIQVSLAYTRIHMDKRWIVWLETFVAVHALVVAYFNTQFFGSSDMWPMFLSGFLFMFVFTYIYALDVRKKLRWGVTGLYGAFIVWLYMPSPIGFDRDITYLLRLEVLWIPVILYLLAALFAGLVYGYIGAIDKRRTSG